MPERVLTKFSDDEPSDEAEKTPKKRNADQAFDETSTKKTSLTERHRNKQQRTAKVVNFGEGSRNSPTTTSKTSFNRDKENGGRLKQRSAALLPARQKLPIYSHAQEIRDKVRDNDVLLLVGETGSGKSTQTPQFLLDLCRKQNVTLEDGSKVTVGGAIAITQPRRVAAISLARRVAEEMGTPLGSSSPASTVGYAVRFDSSVSPNTKVKFLTDGTLLQELLRDPWLRAYSVVVVDEVHERGVNVDLVLGFLRRMIEGRSPDDGRGGHPLKVVIMSATADMEKIQNFFGADSRVSQRSGHVTQNGTRSEHMESDTRSSRTTSADAEDGDAALVGPKTSSCHVKGRQYPVQIKYTSHPVENVLDATLEQIKDIHTHQPLPGDVLVFLPGQETIDSLESMCISYAQSLLSNSKVKGAPRLPKLLILPLFAALPTALQQRVFEPTPPFTRKIILSTNIAETSVTVPGIRHVIDTGKRKARFFRPQLNLDTLLTRPISRSSGNQRAGRAGREAAGSCYRLYTEKTFYELDADTEPEILRCDLSQLVLTLKAHSVDDILSFPLLTSPPRRSLERALLQLLHLDALDRKTGQINSLGRQMSTLPLPANLARILLASQLPEFDCLEEIIDIVSGLSVENIWLPIHNMKQRTSLQNQDPINGHLNEGSAISNSHSTTRDRNEEDGDDDDEDTNPIAQARRSLYRREGDHLTLLAAIQSYTAENVDRKEWCRRHGISHRAISSAMDVRKQLRKLMLESKRYRPTSLSNQPNNNKAITTKQKPNPSESTAAKPSTGSEDLSVRILKTLLLGHKDNIARLSTSTSTSTSSSNGTKAKTPTQDREKETIWTGPYTRFGASTHDEGKNMQIHPSSILFNPSSASTSASAPDTDSGPGSGSGARSGWGFRPPRPKYIIFNEFVITNRAYLRTVSVVDIKWIEELVLS